MASGPQAGTEQATFLEIDQNALAFHLCLGLASALYVFARTRSSTARVIMGLLGAVLIVTLILVGSRTGVGAGLLVVAAFLLLSLRSLKQVLLTCGFIAVGGYLTFWIASAGLVPLRVLAWLEHIELTDNRTEIIELFRLTESEWIVRGIGAGADADYLWAVQSFYKNAHSAFWQTLIEQGIFGTALLGMLLIGLAYRSYRSFDRDYFLLSCIPVGLFFYTLGGLTSNMLWAIFGLALGASPTLRPTNGRTL